MFHYEIKRRTMKKRFLIAAFLSMIAAAMLLSGCGEKSGENTGPFEPDLAGTEWLTYKIGTDDSYVASAEYVFSEDRVKFLEIDNDYNLYTGEEAYTEALITEDDANAMYTSDSFGGDEKGGFITIIMPYENGGKDGLYGWMNRSMDKMELTDPYDGAKLFFFRKDSEAAADYEKGLEPYFDSFMKENFGDEYEVSYKDKTLVLSKLLDDSEDATEEAVKSGYVIGAMEKGFDQFEAEGAKLAGSLENMLYLDGVRVRLDYTFKDEVIGSATYDKSGEIKEERFLYGN